ncbi:hypothetical protein FRC03_003304 [Tulasnella sp. 419]|nr:hypothetical protein FRC02_001562 [Tulasnella sp. 418]KAG8942323.1 hypothetical protein FRC03_003304 [Tulasnella sp. 419]
MPHNDPIVDLGYARYRGCRTGLNVLRYLGLPYAEPPIGERRFRKPVPLDTDRIRKQSNGTAFNAREYPDFALQGCISSYDIGGAGSEDCLKLDIYINESALSKDSPLPVLVYIHGGGYRLSPFLNA